jgi:hypothetical protein
MYGRGEGLALRRDSDQGKMCYGATRVQGSSNLWRTL